MRIKRLFVGLALATSAFAVATGLSACGGAAADDPNLGRYTGYAVNITGDEMAIEDIYESGESYLELKAGDVATMSLDGDVVDGTWKLDGDDFTFTASEDGETYESAGTLRDGVITLDYFGFGITLTFVRDGVDKPFLVMPVVDGDINVPDDGTGESAEDGTDEGADDGTDEGTGTEGVEDEAAPADDGADGADADADAADGEDGAGEEAAVAQAQLDGVSIAVPAGWRVDSSDDTRVVLMQEEGNGQLAVMLRQSNDDTAEELTETLDEGYDLYGMASESQVYNIGDITWHGMVISNEVFQLNADGVANEGSVVTVTGVRMTVNEAREVLEGITLA